MIKNERLGIRIEANASHSQLKKEKPDLKEMMTTLG